MCIVAYHRRTDCPPAMGRWSASAGQADERWWAAFSPRAISTNPVARSQDRRARPNSSFLAPRNQAMANKPQHRTRAARCRCRLESDAN
jgi:hypothetical protein